MANQQDQPGFERLWAPWRIDVLKQSPDPECFFCRYRDEPDRDRENFVVGRDRGVLAVLNRYPYNNGHLLVAPLAHQGELEDLGPDEEAALWAGVKRWKGKLAAALNPHGFNIGINLGTVAGAGVPGHLHVHLVPRWPGDTSFITTVSDSKVISQSLAELHRLLTAAES